MPFPLLAIGIAKLVSVVAPATVSVIGALGRGQKREADAFGAQITNAVESAMDLNRWAFASGTIPWNTFQDNYNRLWGKLQDAVNQISTVSPGYAAGMIRDREYGGQWAHIWRGVLRDDLMRAFEGKLDNEGFVLPEHQWAWPEKSKYQEITPLEGFTVPQLQAGETAGGPVAVRSGGASLVLGVGIAAVVGLIAWRLS